MEIETTENFGEIPSEIVRKINKIERDEKSIVIVEFQIIYPDIWVANVIHKSRDGKSVFFSSLNMYQKESRQLCFNMQDGKVYGFEVQEYWVDAYREFPDKPEHFIAEILHDLFIVGWDMEDSPSFGEPGYSELDEERELAEMEENEIDEQMCKKEPGVICHGCGDCEKKEVI